MLCAAFVAGMVGMAYAAVPLYDLFCRVTGYGGTTQRADQAPAETGERRFVIRFDANVAGGLPWNFQPLERSREVVVGEVAQTAYEVVNIAARATAGTASFNVTPQAAGAYFNKLECFCFSDQQLAAGERLEMPVVFFVDPAIANEPELDSITTITLSYTFFQSAIEEEELAAIAR